MLKPPMDEELYAAAMRVMEEIDEKIRRSGRSPEDALGESVGRAYRDWENILVVKYAGPPDPPKPVAEKKIHPWRRRYSFPKR